MIQIENISYGRPQIDGGNVHYQDILHNEEIVGVLIAIECSILLPIEEQYQFGASEKDIPEDIESIESEDEEWNYVVSNTLEDFIIRRNKIYK